MSKAGAATRSAILDTAEQLVLDYGFAGASIDKVIEKAGITKGTFFYHFKSKQDLARDLITRFHDKDMDTLSGFMKRAEKVSADPLQQLLIFVGFLSESMDRLEEPFPGCLFVSYVYQSQQFTDDIMAVCSRAMLDWRQMYLEKLEATIAKYPPQQEVDAKTLADMLTCIFEGALALSKTLQDPKLVAPQLTHYRQYLQLLFTQDH